MPFTPSSEQSTIIDFPPNPLRIAAGAGTGKTTTIVHRLAAAVAGGGDPARALGITFTNKAADELRSRLADTLGNPERGREPEVATYHSFAASILDEFGSRVGYTAGGILMDEGHRSQLAMLVLRSLHATTLDLTALPQRRDELLHLAASLVDNLTDAQQVRAHTPAELDATWTTRLALLDAAERYQDRKQDLDLIEYGDLIRLATDIVISHPEVAEEIRGRYDTVLLDEYQDTDRAQQLLLTSIFATGMAVTAVGDTDQTIYEWRGASIDNFEGFPQDFPNPDGSDAATLDLTINRRSDRLIIDMANAVRGQLPPATGSADLRPQDGAGDGTVVAAWLRTEADEAAWIAAHINERHDEGVRFANMAVLCRKRESLRPIAAALRDADIPISIGSMGELLEVPEVADLHAWLRILANPHDEGALLRVLLGGRYRLGMADIAAITRAVKAGGHSGLMEQILDPTPFDGLDANAQDALGLFAATYEPLFRTSQASTVTATLDAVIAALDYWAEVPALQPASAITARINISRFLDLADRWKPIDGVATLGGYLRYLDALNESGRADELDAAQSPADDAVRLLTAHGAKGLEWDEVYVPSLSAKVFPSDVLRYYDPLDSPVALPYGLRLDADAMAEVDQHADPKERRRLLKTRHDHQEWRLAYVAVTRARHRLVMSGHIWHGDNVRPREPSELLQIATQLPGVTFGPITDEPGERPERVPYVPPALPPDPLFDDGWGSALRRTVMDPTWMGDEFPDLAEAATTRAEQLTVDLGDLHEPAATAQPQRFATSVTNLVALAECPLRFKWIHHDRLPRRPRMSAVRGTEFHRKAELHNLGIIALDDAADVSYDSLGDASDAGEQPDGTSRPAIDPWDTFAASRFADNAPFLVETPFEITIDGRTVRGKVDAVYRDEDAWEIVDYKSGRASPSDEKLVQLQAYALAARDGNLSTSTPGSIDVTFAWFGSDEAVEVSEHADDAWMDNAEQVVGSLLQQAEDGPFDPRPGNGCQWCDFLHHCEAGTAQVAQPTTEP
ncbi:MAG: ATP-dependent DNA helicase [Acidimicrobiia bacterium]